MSVKLQGLVDSIVTATAGLPDPQTLASWSPPLSGDIDIVIRRDGSWEHEGEPIYREGLVRVFASLLRREKDGEYYLVTPHEKWRLQVERHALQAIDCEQLVGEGGESDWFVLLNTGGRCRLGGEQRLHASGRDGEPYTELPNGLTAQISRAAWYRLIDAAENDNGRIFIRSAGEEVELGSAT
jgi:hypothetical protein